LPSLIKKADAVFGLYIRNRDAVLLQGRCCTCGAIGSQAGHFVKRGYKKIRWHVQNVHLQCVQCNHFLDGNEGEYARFIINTYGINVFNWLLEQKKVSHKVTRYEVERVIATYSK